MSTMSGLNAGEYTRRSLAVFTSSVLIILWACYMLSDEHALITKEVYGKRVVWIVLHFSALMISANTIFCIICTRSQLARHAAMLTERWRVQRARGVIGLSAALGNRFGALFPLGPIHPLAIGALLTIEVPDFAARATCMAAWLALATVWFFRARRRIDYIADRWLAWWQANSRHIDWDPDTRSYVLISEDRDN